MTSQSASKILSNNIDLIFIDGSHTFESAKRLSIMESKIK